MQYISMINQVFTLAFVKKAAISCKPFPTASQKLDTQSYNRGHFNSYSFALRAQEAINFPVCLILLASSRVQSVEYKAHLHFPHGPINYASLCAHRVSTTLHRNYRL